MRNKKCQILRKLLPALYAAKIFRGNSKKTIFFVCFLDIHFWSQTSTKYFKGLQVQSVDSISKLEVSHFKKKKFYPNSLIHFRDSVLWTLWSLSSKMHVNMPLSMLDSQTISTLMFSFEIMMEIILLLALLKRFLC